MTKRILGLMIASAAILAGAAAAAGDAPFSCRLRETTAFLPELATYGGYQWIECRVAGATAAEVESVAVNDGLCATFDYWYADRVFAPGETINIPYACMSPVSVAIAANGSVSRMRLR
jgi:hypothetical protein